MKKCSISDFREIISPWLSGDYLKKVFRDDKGHLVLLFTDGVTDVYQIEDCSDDQLKVIFDDMQKNGVLVEE